MNIIDSHCHLNFADFTDRIDDVLNAAALNQVSHMLCVSVNLEDYPEVLALATKYEHIFASVGVHPCYEDVREPSTDDLVKFAAEPKVVAIGETGLDYFRVPREEVEWQRDRFRTHIRAARRIKKPLIIHTRDAADDTMAILKQESAEESRGVMHCFAEDWEVAKKALDLGFYISFSGIVTFKNAQTVQDVAKKCPLDRILVETDAPYLAPVPHRGKTNEPSFVRHTAQFVADLRGIQLEQLAEQTTNNFFDLFTAADRLAA